MPLPRRSRALLPLVALSLLGLALAGRPAGQDEPVARELGEGLTLLTGAGGGNALVLRAGEDSLVIDTRLAGVREATLAQVRAAAGGVPRFVVNTHWHGDHTGNNEPLGSEGATVLAHRNVRARLAAEAGVEGRTGDAPAVAWPSVTWREEAELFVGPEPVRLWHPGRGHTDGDTVVFLTGRKVVHMGDLFFQGRFPYVDLSSGGNAVAYLESVRRVRAELDETWRIVPGHGEVCDVAELDRFLAVLETSVERVRAGLARGADLDTLRAEGIFADLAEDWSWRLVSADTWVKVVADSVRAADAGR